jgi:hypothetical protein
MRRVLTLVVIGAIALAALCVGCSKKGGASGAAATDPAAGPAEVKARMASGGGTSAGAVPAGAAGKAAPAGEKAADEKK